MKRSLAWVYVAGLFLLGILIGALAMTLFHLYDLPVSRSPGEWGPGAHFGRGEHLEILTDRLELTEEQSREIGAILDASQHEAHELHQEMLPRVHALMDRTRESIDEALRPDQRERLDGLTREHRGRLERLFLGHGPAGHRPRRGRGRPPEAPATD